MIGYIYAHKSPVGKYYIGQTTRSLSERFGKNGSGYTGEDTLFSRAIFKYGWDAFEHLVLEKVEAETVEELYDKLNELEIFYINKYNSMSPFGYNIRAGGNGPLAEESRQKISDKLKGKKKSQEHKKALSEAAKRRKASPETRSKMSASLKGKIPWNIGLTKDSSEIIMRSSQKLKEKYKSGELNGYWAGKTFSDEYVKKLSEAHKGIKLSEETKKKMSKSKKGIKKTDEARKKMSEAHKGIPLSDEHKKKLSESHKGLNKGKLYINNGLEMKMVFEEDFVKIYEPLGWVRGYLKKDRAII